MLYAYTSGTGNNGSAFAGLIGNTPFYNLTIGLAMLFGRFLMIVPDPGHRRLDGAEAAGAAEPGHLPDHWPALGRPAGRRDPDRRGADLLPGALALGPIVEHLLLAAGQDVL